MLYTEQVYAMVNFVAVGFLFIMSFASEVKSASKSTFVAITIFIWLNAIFKTLGCSGFMQRKRLFAY